MHQGEKRRGQLDCVAGERGRQRRVELRVEVQHQRRHQPAGALALKRTK